MVNRGCNLSKPDWKKLDWDIAWRMEDEEYDISFMYGIIDRPLFLAWWII